MEGATGTGVVLASVACCALVFRHDALEHLCEIFVAFFCVSGKHVEADVFCKDFIELLCEFVLVVVDDFFEVLSEAALALQTRWVWPQGHVVDVGCFGPPGLDLVAAAQVSCLPRILP